MRTCPCNDQQGRVHALCPRLANGLDDQVNALESVQPGHGEHEGPALNEGRTGRGRRMGRWHRGQVDSVEDEMGVLRALCQVRDPLFKVPVQHGDSVGVSERPLDASPGQPASQVAAAVADVTPSTGDHHRDIPLASHTHGCVALGIGLKGPDQIVSVLFECCHQRAGPPGGRSRARIGADWIRSCHRFRGLAQGLAQHHRLVAPGVEQTGQRVSGFFQAAHCRQEAGQQQADFHCVASSQSPSSMISHRRLP